MTEDVVLVIEDNDAERLRLRQAFHSMGIRVHEVSDSVHALGVLGRIPFQAVVASVGPRALSLRGVCKVARRHHPDIILAMRAPAGAAGALRDKLDEQIAVLPLGAAADDVAREVVELIDGRLVPAPQQSQARIAPASPLALETPTLDDSDVELGPDAERADELPEEELAPPPEELSLPLEATSAEADAPALPVATEALEMNGYTFDENTIEVALDLEEGAPALFEGDLHAGEGAAILIAAFAQELTGCLEVSDGRAAGKFFFIAGAAAAYAPPDGDLGLKAKLVERQVVLADLPLPHGAGALLSYLVEQGFVSAKNIDDFERDLVRDASLALIAQTTGTYRFVEDLSLNDGSLLHRVNPFGMIFEACRRATPPQVLLSRAGELASKVLLPQPLLPAAARKLRPFVRDHDLGMLLDRPRTVRDLQEATGLDDLMGTLVTLTLIDAQLVRAVDAVPPLTLDLPARHRDFTSLDPAGASTSDGDALADELLDLYVRLKPAVAPGSILGVDENVEPEALRRAYLDLMATLDPARLSEGPEHRILRSRVLEMRDKVASAYRELAD